MSILTVSQREGLGFLGPALTMALLPDHGTF